MILAFLSALVLLVVLHVSAGPGVIGVSAWSPSFVSPSGTTPTSTSTTTKTPLPGQDRRTWLIQATTTTGMVVALWPTAPCSAAEFATQAGRRGCTTVSDPAKTVVTCTGELLQHQAAAATQDFPRLSSIAATENGVSTSAIRNPAAYMAPWSYLTETSDANKAWKSLIAAVEQIPQAQLVTVTATYLHATVPSSTSRFLRLGGADTTTSATTTAAAAQLDDVECLLRPDDQLVLFRSASRTATFVYPLTQPVSDGNSNRQRMERLRQTLGWQELS